MSRSYVPREMRRRVEVEAKFRCGYCLTQAFIIGQPMEVEHIIPESAGGETTDKNLWLACNRCNRFKGDRTSAIDPVTNEQVPLFNPRTQRWSDHFEWQENGIIIAGLTVIGRATVEALQLNNTHIVPARQQWVIVGWHPPND